ncbi:hypothetical protein BpHYR1_030745 [Brachionus plicatilis]|uniref:Uncharacterized protein n=1 Tax=Brachionus plicatilis TaxID=10195 RepID=A0A3M7PSQ5_BRAPC|nr:hypothetical protein BpHYR1_030745 [Brachionus plicatilis]
MPIQSFIEVASIMFHDMIISLYRLRLSSFTFTNRTDLFSVVWAKLCDELSDIFIDIEWLVLARKFVSFPVTWLLE